MKNLLSNTKVIIFLIIAVLAVIIVIQQTSPQVTRAGDLGDIFNAIYELLGDEKTVQQELDTLLMDQLTEKTRRVAINKKLTDLNKELNRVAEADKNPIKNLIQELNKEKDDIGDAIRELNGKIKGKQSLLKGIKSKINKLQKNLRGGAIRGPFGRGPFLICVAGTITFFCFDVDPAYAGFSTFVTPISTPPATPPERLKKVEEAIIPFIKFRSFPPTTPLPSTIP